MNETFFCPASSHIFDKITIKKQKSSLNSHQDSAQAKERKEKIFATNILIQIK